VWHHYTQWLNWGGGGSRGISAPPPLILDPPHVTRRSLGYCACLSAPFDLFQLFNHRALHTKRSNELRFSVLQLWTKTDISSARWDGMLYACSKLFPESDKRIV